MSPKPASAPQHRAAITLRNLTVAYNRVPAVHHISGSFPAGSLTAVVGPNGAGKSTLLKAITGALTADEGTIEITGIAPRHIAYLPQRAQIDQTFPISIRDAVSLGLWRQAGIAGGIEAPGEARIAAALDSLGLAGLGGRPIGSLSVGQFQRVLFARLMLQESALILLDEPFAGLDMPTTADLMRQIAAWHSEGRTIVAVLHDLAQVTQLFPQTLLLSRGRAIWGATETVLTAANLAAAGYAVAPWSLAAAPRELLAAAGGER